MMKIFLLLIVFSFQAFAGSNAAMIIDKLISKDNYATEAWFARGLNPSPEVTVFLLNSATKEFLIKLKSLSTSQHSDNENLKSQVSQLVDQLPWEQLDTEEKEFMADVLAPAIESVGLNPWHIF